MMERAPELRVQITKRRDGGVVLRCERRDGSATWQRHPDRHALYFAFHDLIHFAVETTFGIRQGFFGLLADGWDIADTGGKGARGPLPLEALWVEHLVGLLERERVGGAAPLTAAEVSTFLTHIPAMGQIPAVGQRANVAPVSEVALTTVRTRVEQLHGEWALLPVGATLELSFDRAEFAP